MGNVTGFWVFGLGFGFCRSVRIVCVFATGSQIAQQQTKDKHGHMNAPRKSKQTKVAERAPGY